MAEARNDPQEPVAQELRQLLDRALASLPEKYRAPLVLCYLEGKTHEQAARQLGWPSGSMSYRLARGRELLRQRLCSQGRALSAALPALLLSDICESPMLPPVLAHATVQAALGLLAPKATATGLISASVKELMEATLKSLAAGRRWLASLLLTLLLLLAMASTVYGILQGPDCNSSGGACPETWKAKTPKSPRPPVTQ